MKLRIAAIAVPLIALAAAGCSSSSSSSAGASATTHTASASAKATLVSGTETMTGKVSGAAVVTTNNPTYPLKFAGPVNTTGTFTPPNTNATHQVGTFKTAAGNMVVSAVVSGQNAQPAPIGHCGFRGVIHAAYTVNGSKSTGKFAGATGSGHVVSAFTFYVKKLSNGKCDMNQNDPPLAKGAFSTFDGAGTLTVRA